MNLRDILFCAGTGFVVGAAWGYRGMSEELEEKLSEIEEIKREYPETYKNVGDIPDKKMKEWRKRCKNERYTTPIGIGGTVAILYSILSLNPKIYENAVVAIPAAYIGRGVGSFLRKLKHRKIKEALKQALNDSENIDKYLLSIEKSEGIRDALGEIEKRILAGEELDFEDLAGHSRKIYDIITQKKTKYANLLLAWSLEKCKDISERVLMQKRVTDFYEKSPPATTVIIGKPKEHRVKIFTKEGDEFYVGIAEWPNLKILTDKRTGVSEGSCFEPEITVEKREKWDSDYRKLTNRILQEGKEYSIMLMNAPSGMPDILKKIIISSSFLPEFGKYHTKGEEDEEEAGAGEE